jgi:hypothetical protein
MSLILLCSVLTAQVSGQAMHKASRLNAASAIERGRVIEVNWVKTLIPDAEFFDHLGEALHIYSKGSA